MEPPSFDSMGERMRLRGRTKLALLAACAAAAGLLTASAGTATGASAASSVPLAGTGSPQTGPFSPWDGTGGDEFAGAAGEEGPDAYGGNIVDRSLSTGPGNGASASGGKKAKSNPTFDFGFQGLNHYQQRNSRGWKQVPDAPRDT